MSSDLRRFFYFFWEKGKRGKSSGEANVNWGFVSGLYQRGIKVEFGGFIGGFGKIFFTKGGIKREKESFWGWEEGRRENLYFFKNFQRGGEEFETLWRDVFLGLWGRKKRKTGKG